MKIRLRRIPKKYFFKMISTLAILGILPFIFISSSYAFYYQNGSNVSTPANKVFNGSAYFAGNTLDLRGIYSSDLYCAGSNVTVDATVAGDILCIGQNIHISGTVGGNVRAIGQNITIDGTVNKNASLIGQNVVINGRVNGEVSSYGQDFSVDGTVGKQVYGMVQNAQISGTLGDSVDLSVNKLTVSNTANIQGNLVYRSPSKGDIAPGTVKGSTSYTQLTQQPQPVHVFTFTSIILSIIYWFISFLLLSIVSVLLFGSLLVGVSRQLSMNALACLGWGLLIFFVTPFVCFLLTIFLIGIPLALVLALLWLAGIILSPIVIAYSIGEAILKRGANSRWAMIWSLLLGLVIISIIYNIPFLGGLCLFLTVIFGLGAMIESLRKGVWMRAST